MPTLKTAACALALLASAGCARSDTGAVDLGARGDALPPPVSLACGGRDVTVQLGDGAVTLVFEGPAEAVVLPRVEAPTGTRFGRADTLFWMKGEAAVLGLGGPAVECVVTGDDRPTAPDLAEPLPEFRGLGQEPGWTIELFADRIAFVGDYDERQVVVPRPTPVRRGGQTRYVVETEANDFELVILERACRDAMSGEAYPMTVIVTLDGDRYRGCGR